MTVSMPDLMTVLPEIWLVVMVSLILVLDVCMPGRNEQSRPVIYGLTQVALFGTAALVVLGFDGRVHVAFAGMVVVDPMAAVLDFFAALAVSVTLVYSRAYLAARGMNRGEFYGMMLFATLGMLVLINADHFLTLYLGLELLALSSYTLVALRRDSVAGTEAAMKYFVLGALASGMLLYGMSMLYGATGSLSIPAVAAAVSGGHVDHLLLVFGLVFIVAGLAFKVGAVPFHMWIPDVYEGAPTAVTLFIGSAPKFAAFAFITRLLVQTLYGLSGDWQQMLMILAVLSIALGNIAAIAQTNLKRMLAYSTIAHMGFVLLGFLSGTAAGVSAALFYAVIYVLMALAAFGIILLLSREGFEADRIDDFKGLNQRSPWYAFMMLLAMFAMAGVPPTVGFYAKLAVLQSIVATGHTGLAIAVVLMSVIGAFYYLRVVKVMYFDAPADDAPLAAAFDAKALLTLNGMALLLLGILPGPLMDICNFAIGHSL